MVQRLHVRGQKKVKKGPTPWARNRALLRLVHRSHECTFQRFTTIRPDGCAFGLVISRVQPTAAEPYPFENQLSDIHAPDGLLAFLNRVATAVATAIARFRKSPVPKNMGAICELGHVLTKGRIEAKWYRLPVCLDSAYVPTIMQFRARIHLLEGNPPEETYIDTNSN